MYLEMAYNFRLKSDPIQDLEILNNTPIEATIELCKAAFDYLSNGPNLQKYEIFAKKYENKNININAENIRRTVEALISFLIDATKHNATEEDIYKLKDGERFNQEIVEVLAQFVTSRRHFVESSIKSANIRQFRLINLEWRLEVRVASRSLLHQSNITVTMKIYLHTEPKNENRDLLDNGGKEANRNPIHPDERLNRKDLLVQTDITSLSYIIRQLENALFESKTRRIRNIVNAIH